MNAVKAVRKHNMTKEQAKDWVDHQIPTLMGQYSGGVSNSTYSWRGDLLEFSGRVLVSNIKGTLRVTETELELDLDGIPFFLQARAGSEIRRWLDENLSE